MNNYKQILEAVNRGIKFALDDFEDQDNIQGQINSKVKYQGGINEYIDLMSDVVDLGLPSGTLWCKYNLDVNPNQLSKAKGWYGKYYAWRELEPKQKFSWVNYKFYKFGKDDNKLTKYCNDPDNGLNDFTDSLTQLLPEDDAAYQNKKLYNFKFHIPTKEQCEELINYTNNYWVNNYDPDKVIHNLKDDSGIKGLNGRVFEETNGNQLFIPAAGFHYGSDIYYVVSNCHLWSSSLDLDNPNLSWHWFFNSDNAGMRNIYRYNGCPIRPVINL